jgi:filamentous hemagglutinin family protein
MNKTFNLVWSAVRGSYIVAHECAKFGGRPSGAGQQLLAASLVLGLLGSSGWALAAPPTPAVPAVNALPTGGQVAAGSASIAQTTNRMDVTQSSQKAILNWQSFNIGSAAQVNFAQPNASAVALNRVLSSDPSAIYGKLTANGQVFLVNQSGVLFGAGSRVDVGGLVASTLNVSDADFMAGRYAFSSVLGNTGMGSVLNLGNITAAQGGYVALLSPEVRNEGIISASLGQVVLGAADAVTLSMDASGLQYAVDQGAVQALVDNKGLVQAEGGQVILSARAANTLASAVINNSGTIEAKGLSSVGGRIMLEADHITLAAGSLLDASGATGGGNVLVGGDWQGSGTMHQATTVTMETGAKIDASATQTGNGGKVVLWSDIHITNALTQVDGEILARGGLEGGDGGHIETSAASVDIGPHAVFNTLAPKGETGLWLLDPYDYTINAAQAQSIASGLRTTNVSITTTNNDTGYGSSGNNANVGNIAVNSTIAAIGLSGIAVANGGSGYSTAPTVTISGGGGTGATATATVSGGVVTGLTVTNAGTGFSFPIATISGGGGSGVSATPIFFGGVLTGFTLTNGGSGYTNAPNVSLTGGGGAGATATATMSGGVVTGFTVTAAGSGYTNPTISFSGGGGSGATATPSLMATPYNTSLSLTAAEKISVAAPITVGSLALTGNSASIGIELAATISTIEAQTYTGKVAVAGATTLNSATGGVTFSSTLNNLAGTLLLTGSSNWTIPTGITTVSAWAVGGGGGGGASQSAAGGGAGGVAFKELTTTPGQTIAYSTGAAGTGFLSSSTYPSSTNYGFSGAGTAGGTTTLTYSGTTLTANGGGGGTQSSSGGVGGSATGGTTNVTGGNGGVGNGGDSTAGSGGGIGGGVGGAGGSTGNGPAGGSSLDVAGLGVALQLANQTLGVGGAGGLTGGFNCANCEAKTATNFGAGGGGQSWYGHLTQAHGFYGGGGGGAGGEGFVGNGGNGGQGVVVLKYAVSPNSLTINAGSGNVDFNGKVGDVANLASLNVSTTGNITFSNTASVTTLTTNAGTSTTFQNTVNTAGAINLTGNGITVNNVMNATAGNITINTDALTFGASGRLQSTGALAVAPKTLTNSIGLGGAAGTLQLGAGYFSTNFVNGFSGITIGSGTTSGKITSAAITTNDHLTLQNTSGGIELTGLVNASTNNLTLNSSGAVTDTGSGSISATGLTLLGGGSVTLDSTSNAITTLATNTGQVAFLESNGFDVGTVGSTLGVTSTGTIDLATQSGNLTISQNISTTDTSASAITLNAGKNSAFGTSTGGNVVRSGTSQTITTGSGGRATIFTGSVSGSTNITSLVGSGSGNFRYNSDEAQSRYDTLGAALGSGVYAIYREQPTVTFTVANASMVYGDAVPSLPLNIGSGVNGDTVSQIFKTAPTLTIGGAKSTSNNYIAGAHTLSVSGTGTDRLGYNLGAITGGGTLTVTAKTVTVAGITAPDKTYDGLTSVTPVATGASVTGLLTGDLLSIAATTGAFADKNAGTGKTVTVTGISFSGTDAANYSPPSSATTTASILQKTLTVTGSAAANRAYDGSVTATLSGGALSGVIAADTANVTLTQAGSFASKNVGTGIVVTAADTLGGSAASNYSLTQPTGLSANITAKTLTVTGLAGTNRAYDGSTVDALTGSATLVGLVTGETLTIGGTTSGTLASPNAGSQAVSTAVTIADYLTFKATNYSLTQPTLANVTISKRIVNLTGNRAYDGTTTVANSIFNLGNLVTGEALTLTGSGTVANKHVGTGKLVTLGSLALGNGTNGTATNYTLIGGTDVATFTAAPLTLTSSNVSKTYDGNTSAMGTAAVASGSTLFSGDSLSGGTFAFTDPNADSGNKAVTVSGVTVVDGNGGADYTVSYTNNTTSTISPKTLSSTFTGVVSKPYDANDVANISGVTWNVIGAVTGETVTLTGNTARPSTGIYADANAGNGKVVTGTLTSGMFAAGSGTLLANYTLPASSTGFGDITKRPITITPNNASKTYGDDWTGNVGAGKTTFTIGGSGMAEPGGTPETITGVTLASTGAAAAAHRAGGDLGMGLYSITASGATGGTFSASNYAISYAPATLTIDKAAALTVTADNASKTYGDVKNFAGTAFTLTGGSLLNADSIASVQMSSAGSAATARRADGDKPDGSGGYVTGQYVINAANAIGGSGTDLANDYASVSYVPGILTLAPRPITVTASDWASSFNGTTAVDLAAFSTRVSGTNLVNGDTIASVTMTAGAGDRIAVGTYTLTPTLAVFADAGGANKMVSDYAVTYADGSLWVDPKAITLRANNITAKTYGTTATFAGFTMVDGALVKSDGTNTDTMDTSGVILDSAGALATANVGTYAQSFTGAPVILNGDTTPSNVTTNYKIAYATDLPSTLTVTPRPITITPTAQTKVYGDTKNLGSASFSIDDSVTGGAASIAPGAAIVNADKISAVTLASAGTAAAAHASATAYDITTSGAVFSTGNASNYAITYATGTNANANALTVNPLAVTITANNATKTYGEDWTGNVGTGKTAFTFVRTNGTNSGAGFLPNGDSVTSLTLASGGAASTAHRTGNSNNNDGGSAGLWNITPSTAQTATPGDYSFTYVAGKLNITPMTITTTVVNQATTYGAPAATSSIVSGTINNDTVTTGIAAYSGVTPVTIEAKTAAGNYTLRADGNLSGDYAADYVLATTGNTDGQLVVNQKTVTASLIGSVSKEYDGTVAISNLLSGNYTIASGIESGDSITLNNPSNGVYDNKNATTGKLVSVSGLAIAGGTGASNYQLASTSASANIGIISAKPVTLTAPVVSRSYNAALTYSTSSADLVALSSALVGGDTVSAATISYTNKDVGSGNKTATLDTASVNDGNGGGNYTVTRAGNSTSSITPALLTITANNAAKIYGDTLTFAGTEFTPTGLQGSETVGGVSLVSAGTVNTASKGFYTIVPSGATGGSFAASNYSLQYVNGTLNVAAAQINVSANISGNPTKVYDGNTTATLSSGDYALTGFVNGEAATITKTLGSYASPNTGTSTVTVVGLSFSDYFAVGSTDLSNYVLPTSVSGTGTITAKPLTLAATANNKPYDGNLVATVTGYGLSGMVGLETLTINSAAANFNSKDVLTANTVTITGIGLTNGTGTNAGLAANYSVANTTTATAQITPKAMTISGITAANKVYDGSTNATVNVGGAQYGGLVGLDEVNVLASGVFVDKNVGVQSVTLTSQYTGADIGNYTITDQATTNANITPKSLSMSGLTVAASKVYDQGTQAVVTGTPALITAEAVGSGSTADGTPYVGDTVSFSGVPIGTYNSPNVLTASQVSYSGLSLTGAQAGNYSLIIQGPSSATITAKSLSMSGLSVPTSKVYDGTTVAVITDARALHPAEAALTGSAIDGIPYTGDTVNFTGTAVGTYNHKDVGTATTVTYTGLGLDNSNYSLLMQSPSNATISPKALTISGLSSQDKVYDRSTAATVNGAAALQTSEAPGAGSTSDGVAYNGDDVSLTGSAVGAFNSKDVMVATHVSFSGLSLSGVEAGNYTLTAHADDTTARITPKGLTINGATASDKVYDGNTTASVSVVGITSAVLEAGGMVAGDDITVAATGNFRNAGNTANDKNVGTGKTVALASIYGGADLGNYTVTDQATTTASISKKDLSISGITAADKVYDGNNLAAVSTAAVVKTGLVNGDDLSVTSTGTFSDKNAANGKTVTLVSTHSGADLGNYTVTDQATTTASITPKDLTLASVSAANKTYDGLTNAVLTLGNLVGLVGSESLDLSGKGDFENANVGIDKTVLVQLALANGSTGLASNYKMSNTATKANINPVPNVVSPLPPSVPTTGTPAPGVPNPPTPIETPAPTPQPGGPARPTMGIPGALGGDPTGTPAPGGTPTTGSDPTGSPAPSGTPSTGGDPTGTPASGGTPSTGGIPATGGDPTGTPAPGGTPTTGGSPSTGSDPTGTPTPGGDAGGPDLGKVTGARAVTLSLTLGPIETVAAGTNTAVFVSVRTFGELEVQTGTLFSFTLPGDTFKHADAKASYTVKARSEDGRALPNWLSFDSASKRFTGKPPQELEELVVIVVATDAAGQEAMTKLVLKFRK